MTREQEEAYIKSVTSGMELENDGMSSDEFAEVFEESIKGCDNEDDRLQ